MGEDKFRFPQLRKRSVDFDEIRTISWKPPTVQNFISIRRYGCSRRMPSLPLSLKRQFPGFMFPQVVQRH